MKTGFKSKRIAWRKATCDRCGEEKFVRLWNGVAVLCSECIEKAKIEMEE